MIIYTKPVKIVLENICVSNLGSMCDVWLVWLLISLCFDGWIFRNNSRMQYQPCHLPIMKEIACAIIMTSIGPYITNWFLPKLIVFFIIYILTLESLTRRNCLKIVRTLLTDEPNCIRSRPDKRKQADGKRSFSTRRRIKALPLRSRKDHSHTQEQIELENVSWRSLSDVCVS